jgi:hypothetical protein
MHVLTREFWNEETLSPIRVLADLRAFVLERSHTRLPRWHFRMADDLVVRLQPKPAERRDRFYGFVGEAFEGQGITRATLGSAAACKALGLWRLRFGIVVAESSWTLKLRHVHWPSSAVEAWRAARRLGPGCTERIAAADAVLADRTNALRARVVEIFRGGRFDALEADMMFSPACLCCGKALTDPVSMARWIGPECAGRAGTLSLPVVVKVDAA